MDTLNLIQIEALADKLIAKHNSAQMHGSEDITVYEALHLAIELKRRLLQMQGKPLPPRAK